jgi:hypothetical protein
MAGDMAVMEWREDGSVSTDRRLALRTGLVTRGSR